MSAARDVLVRLTAGERSLLVDCVQSRHKLAQQHVDEATRQGKPPPPSAQGLLAACTALLQKLARAPHV